VRLLIEKGANVDSKDEDGWTALWHAAANGHEVVMKLLIEKGADVDSKNKNSRTPLSSAIEWEQEGMVRLLVEKGANVESEDRWVERRFHRLRGTGIRRWWGCWWRRKRTWSLRMRMVRSRC
jgi:ankyrin repeat protein